MAKKNNIVSLLIAGVVIYIIATPPSYALVSYSYRPGEYGIRKTVPHAVKMWSDDDYTTSTDVDVYINRIKTKAFDNWKPGSRTGGPPTPSMYKQAFDNAALAYKYGTYYEDPMDFFWDTMRFVMQPYDFKAYTRAQYALTDMPLPSRTITT